MDGDDGTSWTLDAGVRQSMLVDLGSAVTVGRVRVAWEKAGMSGGWSVAVGDSPQRMMTVLRGNGSRSVATGVGSLGHGRYVLLRVDGSGDTGAALTELEVYPKAMMPT